MSGEVIFNDRTDITLDKQYETLDEGDEFSSSCGTDGRKSGTSSDGLTGERVLRLLT